MKSHIINTIGLSLVIVGCVILYKFGLSADVRPSGKSFLALEQVDEAEIAKGKRYICWGRAGIILVLIGSVIQVWATWVT